MWEVFIEWNDGDIQIFTYNTKEGAEIALETFRRAFGKQFWGCVRKKL